MVDTSLMENRPTIDDATGNQFELIQFVLKKEQKHFHLIFTGGAPPKSRITKSNTMSNATGRAVLGQTGVDKRRSAFEATKFSTSSDKNDEDLESDFMHRLLLVVIQLK